ncbi:hypothetical protein LTR85_005386 [Meristemomyces frigidus]|nr:hypothetical protein LTR85_005386 [Meristemomyces frigidus]
MSGNDGAKSFYLVSVSCGLVLAPMASKNPSGVVVQNANSKDNAQQWVIEYGEQPDTFALRNCSNGDYLHADGGKSWATVGTGAKQLWKMDNNDVTPPQACRLSPVEYPKVYLNHFQGQRRHNMKVHMWQWEKPNEFCLSWWLMPGDGTFNPQATAGSGSQDDGSKAKELEEREAALAKREQELASGADANAAKLKDLEEREAALAKQRKELETEGDTNASKLKDVEQREAALAQTDKDLASRDAEQKKLADQLKAKEDELAKREQGASEGNANATQLKDLGQREAALAQQERDLASRHAAQNKRADELKAQEDALAKQKEQAASGGDASAQRQKDLEQREAALAQKEKAVSSRHAAQKFFADQLKAQEDDMARKGAAGGDDSQKQAEMQRKIDELRAAERALAAKHVAMDKQKQQNDRKAEELRQKEKELPANAGSNGADPIELLKAENENLKLKLQLKDLEKQLADAKRTASPPNNDEIAKLKAENARLKALIGQQVNQKQKAAEKQGSPAALGADSQAANGAGGNPASRPRHNQPSTKPASKVPGISAGGKQGRTSAPHADPPAVNGAGANSTSGPKDSRPSTKPASKVDGATAGGKQGSPSAPLADLPGVNGAGGSATTRPKDNRPSTKPASKVDSPTAGGKEGSPSTPRADSHGTNGASGDTTRPSIKPASKVDTAPPRNTAAGPANTSKRITKPTNGTTPNGAATNGHPNSNDDELERLRNENARLKEAKRQAQNGAKPSPSATKAVGDARPQGKSNAGGGTAPSSSGSFQTPKPHHTGDHSHGESQEPITFRCGHVAYPLPRKLDRKVLGMLYEQPAK